MKILVKVTKEILWKSKMCMLDQSVYTNCAVSLAIREIIPMASVRRQYIDMDHYKIRLPEIASSFIDEFDSLVDSPSRRVLMTPISFEIDVPNEVIESIGISQVYKILSESKTLEHVN